MKVLFLSVAIALVGSAVFAQEPAAAAGDDWTRLATENNEVSVSFPPGYIADVQEKKSGQKYFVYGFADGTEFEFKVFADELAPRNLQLVGYEKSATTTETKIKIDDILGKIVMRRSDPYEASFYFASKQFYYIVRARSPKGDNASIQRFARSLRLKGKPIVQATGTSEVGPTVALSTLRSSPEIVSALDSKSGSGGQVEYVLDVRELTKFQTDPDVRPAVIVQRQFPKLEYKHLQGARQQGTLVVKLRTKFLANGQIGDIGVYSETNREFSDDCVNLAKKIKFIPAKKDGRPVDSYQIVTYYFVFAPFDLKY